MESVLDLGTRGHYSRCWDGSVGPATLRGEEGRLKGQKPRCGRIWGACGVGLDCTQGRERYPKGKRIRGGNKPTTGMVPEGRGSLALVYLMCLRKRSAKGPSGERAGAPAHKGIC